MLLWWSPCYCDDNNVTWIGVLLYVTSMIAMFTLIIVLLCLSSSYFDGRHVTLNIGNYFDGRQVTWMIVMPLRSCFHSIQSTSYYWITVQAKLDDSHHSNDINVWVLYKSEKLKTVKFTEMTDIFEGTSAQVTFEQINRWPEPLTDSLLWFSKHTANTALHGINPIYLSKEGAYFRCRADLILTYYLDKRCWSINP